MKTLLLIRKELGMNEAQLEYLSKAKRGTVELTILVWILKYGGKKEN